MERTTLDLTPAEYLSLLHPSGCRGKVTLAQKASGNWAQRTVKVEALSNEAIPLAGAPDVYVTPNRFHGPRSTKRLAEIGAAYSDLDFYNAPEWANATPERVMYAALDQLEDERVPLPSMVLFSGRGLLLLWLHSPQPPRRLREWNALQDRIFSVLRPFAPDPNAKDVARVFRIAGSVNGKSGERVRLLWSLLPTDELPLWPFEMLQARAVRAGRKRRQEKPVTRLKPKARNSYQQHHRDADVVSLAGRRAEIQATGTAAAPKKYTGFSYWGTVLADLHRLRAYRHPDGLLPPGQRDLWMFLAAVALDRTSPPQVVVREMERLGSWVADWTPQQVQSCITSVLNRARRRENGEFAEFGGKVVELRYRFRAKTIIDWLGITPEEMRGTGLRVLVNPEIRGEHEKQRKREVRRQRGVPERSSYLDEVTHATQEQDKQVLGLRND